MKAFHYQTVNYEHIRPPIDLGNLNGPEGNAYIVNSTVSKVLLRNGFTYEANEIGFLLYELSPNYEKSFDKIAFYFNLAPKPEKIDLNALAHSVMDQGDDIVFKISKKDIQENNLLIDNYNRSLMIDNSFDKSGKNYLGRNKMFYIADVEKLQKMTDSEIRDLLVQYDEINSYPYMHILKRYNYEHSINVLESIIDNYSSLIDLSKKDMFGRNMLTQFFYIIEPLESKIKTLENWRDKINEEVIKEKFGALLKTKSVINKLKNFPGFEQALEHHNESFSRFNYSKKMMNILLGNEDVKSLFKIKGLEPIIEKFELSSEINTSKKAKSVLKV